jgi:hypothetical protein
MISDRYDPADFLKAVMNCDLLRLQTVVEEELRVVDLTCRRAWNDGQSVPATAPRYLNFLRRLSAWLDAGGESRVRLSPDLRDPWRVMIHRLVEKGQLKPTALRSLGRKRTGSHQGPQRPFVPEAPAASVHALSPARF